MPITGAPSAWSIVITNKGGGTTYRTLANPTFNAPAVDTLNSVGMFSFTLGLYDADAPDCNPKNGREAKLYRGAALWQTYRIWQSQVDFQAQTVTFSCFSLLDYFRDRYIDRGATRTNLLSNGSFDGGALTGWTATATTATAINSDHVDGTYSAQLVQASVDADAYLSQAVSYTGQPGAGDVVTLVAWAKITAWTGPAIGNFGLVLVNSSGGTTYDTATSGGDINWNTLRGQWVKLQVQTTVPASTIRTLTAKLYSPQGTVEWDTVFMGLYESLSNLQTEQTQIAANIVGFLQDTTKGKDAVLISSATALTTLKRDRTYQFADHISGLQALTEFPRLVDGFDFQITPARVFTCYALPTGIGTDKTATVTLTYGSNCEPVRQTFDGPQGASDVTTLANGSGPGREEAGAVDNTVYGGCTVQQVLPAPSVDTKIDSLPAWASRQLSIYKDPTVFELIVTDRAVGFALGIGDHVTLSANLGYVQESGHARVVALSADPVTDLVTATLNRVT